MGGSGSVFPRREGTKDRGRIRPQPGTLVRLQGRRSLGAWSLSRTSRGSSGWGEHDFTPTLRMGVLSAGPAPGPSRMTRARAARVGGAPRREALFHFPALLRFLRSVSLTSLNFTALGLWPTDPPRGGSGCWVWAPPPAEGWPHQAGRRSGPGGARTLQGAQPATPLWFPWAFLQGIWAVPTQGVGFVSVLLRPCPAPFPRLLRGPHLPSTFSELGVCVGVRRVRGSCWKRR